MPRKPVVGERLDHFFGDRLLLVEPRRVDQPSAHPVERGEQAAHGPRLVRIALVERGGEGEEQRVVDRAGEDAADEGGGVVVAHGGSLDAGLESGTSGAAAA